MEGRVRIHTVPTLVSAFIECAYIIGAIIKYFVASQCPSITDPKNGSVELSSLLVGSMANFSCDKGFILYPANVSQITCLPSGEWFPFPPTCEGERHISCCDFLQSKTNHYSFPSYHLPYARRSRQWHYYP